MVEMMIIIGGVLPDMNPVDVLHRVEKFELHFEVQRRFKAHQ